MKMQHYLGGLEGLDTVTLEKRVFVEPWEKRIFGIHTAMMALSSHLEMQQTPSKFSSIWTWADLRKGAESMNPFDYFKFRYYEKWLGGISAFFVANGYVTEEEIEARAAEFAAKPDTAYRPGGEASIDERVVAYLRDGDSPRRDPAMKPRFSEGETVLVRDVPTVEHTRLPGYLRNHTGVIHTVYPDTYVYLCSTGPDGVGPAMPVYCVEFDPGQLWEAATESNSMIYADLYEAYLDKAV